MDKRLYIEETQFDTELAIYREPWKELCEVRKAGWDLKRQSSGSVSLKVRINEHFRKAVNGSQFLVEPHRPFMRCATNNLRPPELDSTMPLARTTQLTFLQNQ